MSPRSAPAGARGIHRGVRRPDGSLDVHGQVASGSQGAFDERWVPAPPRSAPTPPDASRESRRLPRLGEYLYVTELPEAIRKVAPEYPEVARKAGVDGTVIVQALVGIDGLVKDTRVTKSIPMLDDAAVASVRRWVFRPAKVNGKPVAVWAAAPVKFSLGSK
jgi:protein TonB